MKKIIFRIILTMCIIFTIIHEENIFAYKNNENMDDMVAYLTFDDGPSANTEKVLNILRENNVKATFFVVGPLKEEDSKFIKMAYDDGHAIGNHTYDHDFQDIYVSENAFWNNFNKEQEFIKSITGEESKLFRFPGGSFNRYVKKRNGKQFTENIIKKLNEKGIKYYNWNVDSGDGMTDKNSANVIYNNIIKESKGKNKIIVLMHDSIGKKTTVEALPSVISYLKNKGYRFDNLNNYN